MGLDFVGRLHSLFLLPCLEGGCKPPADYGGFCGITDFHRSGLTSSELDELTLNCRAQWPCQAQCHRDVIGCPEAWENIDGLCLAPASYAGECSPAMHFHSESAVEKLRWAARCDAVWPCTSVPGTDRASGPVV